MVVVQEGDEAQVTLGWHENFIADPQQTGEWEIAIRY
jgi:hypothetical protein